MSAIPMRSLILPTVDYISSRWRVAGGKNPCVMMGAIGSHESEFKYRDQQEVRDGKLVDGVVGPATGFWQFEKGGGIAGVMTHPASKEIARYFIEKAGLPQDREAVWRFIGTIEGDELASVFARLLLLTDPQPLPEASFANEEAAFQYYLRNWRPGAWFRSTEGSEERRQLRAKWARNWAASLRVASEIDWSAPTPEIPAPVIDPVPMSDEALRLIGEIRERLAALERIV